MVITSTLDIKFLLNVFEMIKVFIILEYEKNTKTKTKAKPNQHSYMNFGIVRNHDFCWPSINIGMGQHSQFLQCFFSKSPHTCPP